MVRRKSERRRRLRKVDGFPTVPSNQKNGLTQEASASPHSVAQRAEAHETGEPSRDWPERVSLPGGLRGSFGIQRGVMVARRVQFGFPAYRSARIL